MPNSRELATIIWIGVALIACLFSGQMRSSLGRLVGMLFRWKIALPILGLAITGAALAYGASKIGLWNTDLVADTVLWFITSGLVLMFGLDRVSREGHFFRHAVLRTLRMTVLLGAYVNLAVFSLPVEITLQPFVFALGGMSAVAATKPEFQPAKRLVDGLIALFGLSVFLYVSVHIGMYWSAFDKVGAARDLVLPVWLTAGAVPSLYLLSLFMNYETTFLRIRWMKDDRRLGWRTKLAVLLTLNVRTRAVANIDATTMRKIVDARSFKSARDAARAYRRSGGVVDGDVESAA